jgi:tetratricopeptide (TPR) repeat protein
MAKRDQENLDFEIEFFEGILEASPNFQEPLMALGNAYTRRGRYREGLDVDRRLVALRPKDPIAHYNLACSLSLLGQLDAALGALERAIHLGYGDFEFILKDPDLENLRQDPRFQQIILQYLRR